jgi:hypothetical protein
MSRRERARRPAVNAKRIVFVEAEQRKGEHEPRAAIDLDLAAKEARFADWIRPEKESPCSAS